MALHVPAIRAWLMLSPRPRTVQISSEDVSPQKIEIPEGTSWIHTAESIAALEPELLEALAPDGKLIRAVKTSELSDDEEEEEEEEAPAPTADPESLRLITFARLISEAYKHSTDTAFNKLVTLFEASTRRAESLEKSLELTNKILMKAAQDQLALQVEQAAGGSGGNSLFEQMVGSFLSSKAQAEVESAARKAAANGAAKPDDDEEDEEDEAHG